MGKATGFKEFDRQTPGYEKPEERVKHYREFTKPLTDEELAKQGARCMDCGIPFCHQGCPVNNLIPDWNDLVYRNRWQEASEVLHSTNNFPEFTGRVCPAPCEASCTLNITDSPVAIKTIEHAVVERAFAEGWLVPDVAKRETGKMVAVVGGGPAGMAAAQQLARAGHSVTLFEKNAKVGGLLRYGIPDFKLEKAIIDRRVAQMEAEGVTIKANTHVGVTFPVKDLLDGFDAVVLTGGSEKPRDLPVPGRELKGVHFAMDFLTQQNRRNGAEAVGAEDILAKGKKVVVIGGGDTGADCVGTSNRQGAASVTQIEIMPRPPEKEDKGLSWPLWPNRLRTSSSHDEGCARRWSVSTLRFTGKDGQVTGLDCAEVDAKFQPIPGTEFKLEADLVLLAMGFVHPVHEGLVDGLGLEKDGRGNVKADTTVYQTSNPKVFAAGDIRRGQSLVVWAIREGRQAARAVDAYLMGSSDLPAC
ncbi:glutamate synthase subunit beta [Paramagnetospirillum magneticum]|uniref:NADPH-dependent glutamate synthase beta chain and related oxidoreductase n=1 Tax=Paramagnetospirillum magneticum (strain ATCC 700264 / AMB-1) TaxID=342108 RepID=Q2W4T9_PARM1|nr:glutamate synthase subunit beta [Paramagnetospirillum magneticum]BAE51136.1 NADPH-dependent glutamate synthase beta chain and related oxidoreductase [Paramagnetospirillum magneticum AMB-1]